MWRASQTTGGDGPRSARRGRLKDLADASSLAFDEPSAGGAKVLAHVVQDGADGALAAGAPELPLRDAPQFSRAGHDQLVLDDPDLHTLGLGDGIEIPVHQGVSPLLGPLELDGREGAGHRRRHSLPSLTGNPLLEHGDILEPTGVKPTVTRTDRLPLSVTH